MTFTKRAGYGSPCLYLEFWTLRQEALRFDVRECVPDESRLHGDICHRQTPLFKPPPHPKPKTKTINKKRSLETRAVFQTDLKVPGGGRTQDTGHFLGCW